MFKHAWVFPTFAFAFLILAFSCFSTSDANAYSSYFSSRCASCHNDDAPTCNGCHRHRGNVSATVNQATYTPGAPVTVTLYGGSRGGWVRGLLYDQNGIEVDRATGPTGSGDDGGTNDVTFPITMQAPAPSIPGQYTWNAGWYGSVNSAGGNHTQDTTPVSFTVEPVSGVPDPSESVPTWGQIKSLYR